MNNPVEEPPFYNDLSLSLDEAWSLVEEGASLRTSPAHTPVVATLGSNGHPQQRVMVLRAVDRARSLLRFHCDARSAKMNQAGSASVLVYHPSRKVQLRLLGQVVVHRDGTEVDAAWTAATPFARRCYMAKAAPGTIAGGPVSGLPTWIEGRQPVESELTVARVNFALLDFTADRVEWLYLANAGHRRAQWLLDIRTGDWSGDWLIP